MSKKEDIKAQNKEADKRITRKIKIPYRRRARLKENQLEKNDIPTKRRTNSTETLQTVQTIP